MHQHDSITRYTRETYLREDMQISLSIRTSFSRVMICGLLTAVFFIGLSEMTNAQALSPATISSINRSTDSPGIQVKGKAAPNIGVNIEVISDEAGAIFRDQTRSNESGEWSLNVASTAFPDGAYTLRAIVQDSRGVLGPATEVRGYKIKPRPLVSIQGVDFGWLDAFAILVVAFIGLAAAASIYHERSRRKREQYIMMTERDMNTMSYNLMSEVDRLGMLLREAKGMEPHIVAEAEYLLKNQHATLEKMQGYLSAGVEKFK
jgi:hypothetical protein